MKEFIAKLRKKAGMSQETLAQKLGISRPTLIATERGERDISVSQLRIISELFDIPMEMILDEDLSTDEKVHLQGFSKKAFTKFHNLILQCIKYGAASDGKITKTKLAKLVYLCDFASYYKFLKPISGFEYRKLPQGPVAIQFFAIIDDSESIGVEQKNKAIVISLLEEPEDTVLDKSELNLIKAVCKKWKHSTTQEIVGFTHNQIPWKVCKEGDAIPYTLINNEAPENVY